MQISAGRSLLNLALKQSQINSQNKEFLGLHYFMPYFVYHQLFTFLPLFIISYSPFCLCLTNETPKSYFSDNKPFFQLYLEESIYLWMLRTVKLC